MPKLTNTEKSRRYYQSHLERSREASRVYRQTHLEQSRA